jgi:hypothetical protein
MIEVMRKKTSLTIDPDIWGRWITFIVTKTKANRRISEITEKALEEFMLKHVDAETL